MPITALAPRTSPITGQIISPSRQGRVYSIFCQFKLIGGYVAAGDPFDLGAAFVNAVLGPGYLPPASIPEVVEFKSILTPGVAGLWVYQWAPGTTLANGKIQVFSGAAAQSPLTEFTAGVYVASQLADLIEGRFTFPVN